MGANDPDRVLPSEDGIAQDLAEAACIENGARDAEDRSSAPCETHGVNLTRVGAVATTFAHIAASSWNSMHLLTNMSRALTLFLRVDPHRAEIVMWGSCLQGVTRA
jgi:hypothetical protein